MDSKTKSGELPFFITRYKDNWGTRILESGKMLLTAGDIATNIFYVESGLLRVFFYNPKTRKESTFAFLSANNIFFPIRSFFAENKPAKVNVEVIEKSIIHSTNFNFWKEMEKQDQELEKFRVALMGAVFDQMLERTSNIGCLTATEHYRILLNQYDYIGDIKNEHVASYLGIDETHLSKIKAKIKPKTRTK